MPRRPLGCPGPGAKVLAHTMADLLRTAPWLDDLREEMARHPAVCHPLLSTLTDSAAARAFGLQHYPLVATFTRYLELLLLRAPSSDQKQWLAKVLLDEYGEGSDGLDHAALYREFLRSQGVDAPEEDRAPLADAVWDFVGVHVRLCREAPFLVGLGALGPGHEWAIPSMFEPIIRGLEAAGVPYEARRYFDLHTVQDVDHAAWMSEALMRLGGGDDARAQVRRGARISLGARLRLWSAILGGDVGTRGDRRALASAVEGSLLGAPWPTSLPEEGDLAT